MIEHNQCARVWAPCLKNGSSIMQCGQRTSDVRPLRRDSRSFSGPRSHCSNVDFPQSHTTRSRTSSTLAASIPETPHFQRLSASARFRRCRPVVFGGTDFHGSQDSFTPPRNYCDSYGGGVGTRQRTAPGQAPVPSMARSSIVR